MSAEAALRRHYSQVYNFPKKLANMVAKIKALRDEANDLGFHDEHAQLAALAVVAANAVPKPKPKKIEWTQDKIGELKTLWLQGKTCTEIARHIGKSRSAVSGAARRHNLPRRQ